MTSTVQPGVAPPYLMRVALAARDANRAACLETGYADGDRRWPLLAKTAERLGREAHAALEALIEDLDPDA